MEISGRWSDGKTSMQLDAIMRVQNSGEVVVISNVSHALKSQGYFNKLQISTHVAETPRRITFDDGAQFETSQNVEVDQLIRRFKKRGVVFFAHRLESNWLAVLLSLFISIGTIWMFMLYGVPAIATILANNLPVEVLSTTDQQIIAGMDELFFQPSEIDETMRIELKKSLLASITNIRPQVKIEFRGSEKMGANAFSLPGGTIVLTDKMLALAENLEQIQAVFAHEVGHLVHKHSLRRIIQNSIVTIAFILVTGDATATSELLATIPFLLTDLAYSRQFEVEADNYALEYLSEHNIDVKQFARLMSRLECSQRSMDGQVMIVESFNKCLLHEEWRLEDANYQWKNYFRSHPPSVDRITQF